MSNDDTQERLDSFSDAEPRRPILFKDAQVGPIHVKSKGRIHPGYRGPIPARNTYGFVGFRKHRLHYHRNERAYILSEKVVDYIRAKGCKLILIAEDDTGDVYVFHESQFDEEAPQRAKSSDEKDETQLMARVHEHRGLFANHAEHVLVGDREIN